MYITPNAVHAQQNLPTKEEQAVENINNGVLPSQIIKEEAENKNLLQLIQERLSNLIGVLFNQPTDKDKFYRNSQNLQTVGLPKELQTQTQDNPLENFKQFLGGTTGLYGVNLPQFSEPLKEVKDYETSYECANFPCQDGIHPIIPN